ncbi:MAG: hypothetical protein K0Q68_1994 [Moraxellaceae bacterium]|jgi:hypothetical protein|nr:hypothetical protein [Moraxellaceae bacterium]
MTHPIPATYRYIAFFDLLADAIFQHKMAVNETNPFLSSRYARASIGASALSVECFANCLLALPESPKKLIEELDKLSPIPKVEIALRLQGFGDLDRGCSEVQKIAELIKARNEFVHSKLTAIEACIGLPQDAGSEWMVPISMTGEHWKQLGIPKVAMFWSRSSSLLVLSAICSFYRHVLVNLMKATEEQLNGAFISRAEFGGIHMPGVYDEFREQISSAAELGIDFSFLGFTNDANR